MSNFRRRRRIGGKITDERIELYESDFRLHLQEHDVSGDTECIISAALSMRTIIYLRRRKIIQDYCE